MKQKVRDYIFQSVTESLCPQCFALVSAKVIVKDGCVFLSKSCPDHGETTCLLEEDANYYLQRTNFDKPGTISKIQTPRNRGCPLDCGLCPDHEQHTCIALIEITNHCDLQCPVCYANGGANHSSFLGLPKIAEMLDFFQDSEVGEAEILQISGGEPTTHPEILKIIELAKKKNIKYVMLNTNGLRLAEDLEFVKALSQFNGGFEIYLQFDGFSVNTHRYFLGRDMSKQKRQALEHLADHHIPTTLVAKVEKGVNDNEIGQIVAFGLDTQGVRGINFQPVAYFGRGRQVSAIDRITLTGVLQAIERQTKGTIKVSDFIPLPCNVDRVAINYLYRQGETWLPITRSVNIRDYLSFIANTFLFDAKDVAEETIQGLLRGEVCRCVSFFKDMLPLTPLSFYVKNKAQRAAHGTNNTFRISVTSFLDAYNFDVKAMKKECVHIITPDLKKIPFSAYNLLHRPQLLREIQL
jgi:7,8-dihydro-6-hydroxymethylpterin dimethyltransferase